MSRLLKESDFVKIGRGHKISYVNASTNDVRCFCPICKKWTFHKLVRTFILKRDKSWNAVYQCKECGN